MTTSPQSTGPRIWEDAGPKFQKTGVDCRYCTAGTPHPWFSESMAAAVQTNSLGTLRKHFTKPSEQVAAPPIVQVLVNTYS